MADNTTTSFDLFADDHDIPMIGGASSVPPIEAAALAVMEEAIVESKPTKKSRPDIFLDDPEIIELTKRARDTVDEMPWKDIVRGALAEAGVAFSSQEAHNRCLAVGDTFLRGVRDEVAAKMRLMMPFERGGAGLNIEDTRKCMHVLMKATETYVNRERRQHEDAKKIFVNNNVAALQKDLTRHEEENAALDTRYKAMTKGVGKTRKQKGVGTDPHNLPMTTESHDLMNRIATRLAVPPKPLTVKRQGPTTPTKQVKTTAAKPPVMPVVPREKTLVSDVRRTAKLTGPVEELEGMTLDDFRRLARFPKEAVRRINEKITTLSGQGFAVKRKGIEAWQHSEVGKMYFEILADVIRGIPVDEVIAKKREARGVTLTKEEFTALMELNAVTRFA